MLKLVVWKYLSFYFQIGNLSFVITGVGERPLKEVCHVEAEVGANSSLLLPFNNPFDYNVIVDIVLHQDPSAQSECNYIGCFLLLVILNMIVISYWELVVFKKHVAKIE